MELDPVDRTKITDISGQRFGMLVALEPAGARRYSKGMALYFRCRCDCGNEVLAQRSNLQKGTRSCGCDSSVARATVGRSGVRHPLFSVWRKMIERCLSPSSRDYKNYGGRGIEICERWLRGESEYGGLDCFVADMGPKPDPQASIERRENHLGYNRENCFWADRITQGRNKRNNRLLTHAGETMPVSAWSERTGVPYFTLMRRVKLGWQSERALTEPVHDRGQAR